MVYHDKAWRQTEPPDQESDDVEYTIDAYLKIWASSVDEAYELANKALVELYERHRIDVELFDAYGITAPNGEEIKPVG